ncbi:MAG: FeoC-like transcriptional regulator [Gammaproteobacteria bacterium]|nr:FeoC-like transcriptional regulator [Gammaproteobacteria bacterium]MBU1656410.1 FeoC-like transcriptional regulator [Gammaproteobacteria bacterium]MBU1960958.1 FeoC-like transcriptional regulator [Gammaproteobacteria bacterium]
MILSQLRDYLKTHHRAALIDLAHHFDADPSALRPMLERLMAKGQVERLPEGTACGGGCCKCDAASIEIYAWKSGE